MKRAERLARHYIRAADLRAVYVARRDREVKIGVTRDPAARARDLKRQRAQLAAVYWFASSASAAAVVAAVAAQWPGIETGVAASASAVKGAIEGAATAARVGFSDDPAVQRRAARVVADIEARVKAMQSSGHLRGLNAEYRAARAEASRRGVPFHSYGDHLERYKLRLLYELARLAK